MPSDRFARGHHRELRLVNFTVFADAKFEFVPGVNVLIGENGTGKTHALKALYSVRLAQSESGSIIWQVYQATEPIDLIRREGQKDHATIKCLDASGDLFFNIFSPYSDAALADVALGGSAEKGRNYATYIPSVDMLGHTKSFLSTWEEYEIDFDRTYRDIVRRLLGPNLRQLNPAIEEILPPLEKALGGELELEGERFYLRQGETRTAAPMLAEGLRKIGTLVRLSQTGWLREGATLYWDEPEVNMNPVLMDELVGAILTLARAGVQVFLATHSYVILKELDLQAAKEPGLVRYFALEANEAGTQVHPSDDLDGLAPNPIFEQYDSLYDRQITRATGRKRS